MDHLWTAFEEMYRTGKPTVSSYIMRSGERRVVYSAPIAPVEIDGTTYAVRAFFSEDARENITEKVQRIILKSDDNSKEI